MKVFAAILAFCASAAVGSESGDCIDPKALGVLMDEVFETVHSTSPDPIVWKTVHKDPLFVLGDGEIFGLKNIKRAGTPEVNCIGKGAASIKAGVEIANVRIIYPWQFSKLGIHKKGRVYGEVDKISANVYFDRSEDAEKSLVLNKFDIVNVGHSQVRVTGATYFTWLISRVATQVTTLLRTSIADALEDQVGSAIADAMNNSEGVRHVLVNSTVSRN